MTTYPSSMAAALGMQPPTPQPERLAWVSVESPPKMIEVLDPTSGEPLGWYAQFDDDLGLTDQMATKARSVCDVVDGNSCEANGCVDSPYERDGLPVGAGIGWVLAGDADERTEWAPMVLVQHKRKVIAVCLGCAPESMYMPLWDEDEEST